MTINRAASVRKDAGTVDAVIGGAPDGARTGVVRGRKEQIALTMPPDLLSSVDDLVCRMGPGGAALINRANHEPAELVTS